MEVSSLDAIAKWSSPLSGSVGSNVTNQNRIIENAQAQAVDVKDQSLRSTVLYTIDHSSNTVPPTISLPQHMLTQNGDIQERRAFNFLHEAVPVLSGALDSDFWSYLVS
jgi:hypothetical protein